MNETLTSIQTQAVWYAWGQQDAGIGRNVDAIAFAQHYRRLDEGGSRPSIQDAWKSYIADEDGMADLDAIDDGHVHEGGGDTCNTCGEPFGYVDEDTLRGDR